MRGQVRYVAMLIAFQVVMLLTLSVAAEDPEAVRAGIFILQNGGNAADAAVSVMLTASVVDYGMFAIGAEVPFIIYDQRSGKAKTLSGLGSAPLDKKSIPFYYSDGIPGGGGIHSVPVPGAVHLFFMGYKDWINPSGWHGGLPPISLVAIVFFVSAYTINLLGRN